MTELFRQTLDSANFGVLTFDREGRLAYLNPAAEELLRGSAQALIGKSYRAVFEGSPVAVRILRKALEEGSAVTAFDVELRHPALPATTPPKAASRCPSSSAPRRSRGPGARSRAPSSR